MFNLSQNFCIASQEKSLVNIGFIVIAPSVKFFFKVFFNSVKAYAINRLSLPPDRPIRILSLSSINWNSTTARIMRLKYSLGKGCIKKSFLVIKYLING